MKLWNVKVYSVKAETAENAGLIVYNGLSLMEFKNFEILRVTEIEH